ncbi:MAG: discoidin domain-containing protein [Candidatus Symbiothrix sp.]|jgi:hypothetical protein|nr:discoidin domain-containing protein [Candidatus Symbiothrix sp.]
MKHLFFILLVCAFAWNVNADDVTLDRTGWDATASSDETYESPNNVFDSNTDSEWRAAPQKVGQWFMVDMKAPQTFNQIVLDQTGSGGDYPRSIAVFVSNDANDWGNAVFVGSGKDAAESVINLDDQTAQYIKFEVLTNCDMWWKIKELNVRLIDDKTLWKQWTGATIWQNGITWNETKNMFDGDNDSRWNTSKQRSGQWVIVDMKEPQTFNQIQLFQNGGDYPRAYEVYVSDNAADWGSAIAVGDGKDFGGTDPSTFINLIETQQKRFVKIVQTFDSGDSDMYWSINEFSVHAIENTEYRFGWTLSVFNQAGEGDAAFQALDNDINTRWGSGVVQEPGQWIILDMKKEQTFNKITMNWAGVWGDYPHGYKIYLSNERLSNDSEAWGEAVYIGENPGTDISELLIDLPLFSARCIKIEQTGTSGGWWTISELQVTDTPTNIVAMSENGAVIDMEYYNLQGVRVGARLITALPSGVYIVKQIYESGKSHVQKILVK